MANRKSRIRQDADLAHHIKHFEDVNGAKPVGVDLAARVFQVCQFKNGRIVNQQMTREEFIHFIVDEHSERYCIGIEACGACNFWSSLITKSGHKCRIFMAAQVKSMLGMDKSDRIDAEGILQFLLSLAPHTVTAKSPMAVSIGSLITAREQLIKQQTQCQNAARSMLYEFGEIAGKGKAKLLKAANGFKPDTESEQVYQAVNGAYQATLNSLKEEIASLTQAIQDFAKSNELCARLMSIPGVGPVTAVTLWPALSEPENFSSGRKFAAFAGVAPRIYGSGGETHVIGVRKGNRSLKRVLFMAAMSRYQSLSKDPDSKLSRAVSGGKKKSVMLSALANRLARACWAVAKSGQPFDAARCPLLG